MGAIGWIILLLVFFVVWSANRSAKHPAPRIDHEARRTGRSTRASDNEKTTARGVRSHVAVASQSNQEGRATGPSSPSIGPNARPLSDLVTVEVTIGGRASQTVPIPQKKRQIREIDVGNGETFVAELSGLGSSFVEQAEQRKSIVGAQAVHVPFKAYWSSYGHMDELQSQWYYYWRSEVLHGRYPPTDLSYIFIHVYECLHGIGFKTMLHAYGHLWTLWHNYRSQHPNLDGYLMTWMLDLNSYYRIGMDPLEIVRSTPGAATSGISSDILAASMDVAEGYFLPSLQQIAKISNYNPRSGKFYREYPDTGLIDRTLALGFKALDDYFRETKNCGVLRAHAPKRQVSVQHPAFAGAVFGYQPKSLLIAEVSAYSTSKELSKLIENTLKLSENILRKQVSFAGQRRGIELPLAIEERIRSVLGDATSRPAEQLAERKAIRIDPELARALEAESVEIRAALIESMKTDEALGVRSTRFDLPANLRPTELTDVDRVASVLDVLSPGELALVHSMRNAGWETKLVGLPQLGEINKHAVLELGEPLVVVEGETLIIQEDYRDELEFLLPRPEYARTGPSSQVIAAATGSWGSLLAAMNVVQAEALAFLVNAKSTSEFDSFARAHGVMGAMLLDEINALALNHIDDNLVQVNDEGVSVFDEYRDDVLHMLER